MIYKKLPILFFLFMLYSALSQERNQLLDSLMTTIHYRQIFNGNVLVTKGDEVIYRKELGRADATGRQSLSADMVFNIGSISKEFSAVGMMLLQEQGKLALEDRVSQYLPQLPSWADQIHIEHLLDFSSGLPKEDDDIEGDESAWKVLQSLPKLVAPAGTSYLYSNFNIFLRKRIIEQVSGKSYEDFLHHHFFGPLQMESAVVDPAHDTPKMAKAFDSRYVADEYKPFLSGQVSMNIDDLQKWTIGLHSGKLIGSNSVLRLFKGIGNKSALGQGIFEDGALKIHWHSGSSYNFQCSLAYLPETGYAILLMTNNKKMNEVDITNAIIAILEGESFDIPKKSIYLDLRTAAFYDGYKSAIALYEKIKEDEAYDVSNLEESLTRSAEFLYRRRKKEDGTGLLKFTLKEFPDSKAAKKMLNDNTQSSF